MESHEIWGINLDSRGPYALTKMESIRNIIYESPLITRIIFDKGEIELRVSETELNIYSKSYSPKGTKVNGRIKKKLIRGYNPEFALARARSDIVQRVFGLEMKARESQLNQRVNNYARNYLEEVRKQREAENLMSLKKVA